MSTNCSSESTTGNQREQIELELRKERLNKSWQPTPTDSWRAETGWNRLKQAETGWNRLKQAETGWNRLKQAETGWNRLKQAETGWNRLKQAETGWNRLKQAETGWNRLKRRISAEALCNLPRLAKCRICPASPAWYSVIQWDGECDIVPFLQVLSKFEWVDDVDASGLTF